MQIVYLSARPQVFAQTWAHVQRFMPWVNRAVVVVPAALAEQFRTIVTDVDIVTDEAVTSMSTAEITALSHVPRNVTLRRAVISTPAVDEVFLLSDDDYRPLKPIDESFFTHDGRDVGYYCYDLGHWPGDETDFDVAQHRTLRTLKYKDFPHVMFGSHMPQLMRKDLWNRAFEVFDSVNDVNMVCEWSLYFNVAMALEPERFVPPRIFQTLCWPQFPGEWPLWVQPDGPSFENYYPDLYSRGGLFEGLAVDASAVDLERENFTKVTRWYEFATRQRDLDFGEVSNPWASTKTRSLAFRALSLARKPFGYLQAGQAAELVELQGQVAQLSAELRSQRSPGTTD